MKNRWFVWSAMLVALAGQAHAGWEKQYEVSYVMGEGDSRAFAREAAIERVRSMASNEVGQYVESTTTLQPDGELQQHVRTVSASMVRIAVTGEQLTVNATGQGVLALQAHASIDDGELARRVQALREDKEKSRLVGLLQAENDRLRADMEQIRSMLPLTQDAGRLEELFARQRQARMHLDRNGQAISSLFERGTLIQMARQDEDAAESAKRALEYDFYEPLLNSAVQAEVVAVERVTDGYDVLVRVGWNPDMPRLRGALGKHLNLNDGRGPLTFVPQHLNADGRGKDGLSERLFQYLAGRGVDLRLSIAGKSISIPVFYADNGFMEPCPAKVPGRGGVAKYLCLVSQPRDSATIRGYFPGVNPVRIRLSKAEAAQATGVEAKMVITQ